MIARVCRSRGSSHMTFKTCLLVAVGLLAGAIHADPPPPSTTPPQGLRQNTPQVHAITHARIVPAAGKVIEDGTIVIRDGVIEEVVKVAAPPDVRVWDLAGKTIYPGLIDAYSELPADAAKADPSNASGAKYWTLSRHSSCATLQTRQRSERFVPRRASPRGWSPRRRESSKAPAPS